jgi:hypothetical protein
MLGLIACGPAQAHNDATPPGASATGAEDSRLVPPFRSFAACLALAEAGAADWQRSQASAALICAALQRVWQDPSDAKAAVDDPLRIDLRLPRAGADLWPTPGVVAGTVLAAFLTIPDLLPPRLGAGLVFENLVVEGTLGIDDATVEPPVVFRRARFRPDKAELLQDHLGYVALRFARARFAAALEIGASDIQGHVLIDDSSFADGLTLSEVVISTRGPPQSSRALAGNLGRTAALSVRNSIVESGLSLSQVLIFSPGLASGWPGLSVHLSDSAIAPGLDLKNLYAEAIVQIEKSELGQVSLDDFHLRGNFIFEHNRISRLQIANGTFHDTPYINHNQAAQNVEISATAIHLQPDDYDPEFAVNQIDGQLLFAPSSLNENVRRVDLTYNRVDGLASVFPPPDSPAEIDLSNVKMPTRLEVGRSYWAGAPERDALFAPGSVDGFCRDGGVGPVRLINLTNATIDILAWNFPIRCDVQWDGAGLAYAYWGDPDLKGGVAPLRTDADFIEALKAWRFTMQEANSEALDFMAGYLRSRGRFSDSRDLQEEAKEVNYRPQTATDLGGWAVYALLLPTGFGVKPELALLWLFVGWLIGGAVYYGYRRRSQTLGWPPPAEREPAAMPLLREEAAGFRSLAAAEQSSGAADLSEQPTLVPGFMQYQRDRRPADFSVWAFSADAVLPVINLHAYTEYYPRNQAVRVFSFVQHIVGWWMLSVFLASATIL